MENEQTETSAACGQSRSTVVLGGSVEPRHGFWFSFKRGEWFKRGNEPAYHQEAGGLSYVGWLTKEQKEELDRLIREYLDRIEKTPNAEVSGAGTASAGLPG